MTRHDSETVAILHKELHRHLPLEHLIAADGRVTPDGLASRIEQWRRAYRNTPHGQPVELSAGSKS